MVRKKTEKRIRYMAFFVIGMPIGILVLLTALFFSGNLFEIQTGCDGADLFFSNTTFEDDYSMLLDRVNYSTLPFVVKSPRALWNGEEVDCKTISMAIRCLSDYYENVECRYYTVSVFDQSTNTPEEMRKFNSPGTSPHIGVRCRYYEKVGNKIGFSSWFTFY